MHLAPSMQALACELLGVPIMTELMAMMSRLCEQPRLEQFQVRQLLLPCVFCHVCVSGTLHDMAVLLCPAGGLPEPVALLLPVAQGPRFP